MDKTSPQSKWAAWWPCKDKGRRLLSWQWTRSWRQFSHFQFSNFQSFQFLKVVERLVGDENVSGDNYPIFKYQITKFRNFIFLFSRVAHRSVDDENVPGDTKCDLSYCNIGIGGSKMSKCFWYWWVESNCISCPTDKRKTFSHLLDVTDSKKFCQVGKLLLKEPERPRIGQKIDIVSHLISWMEVKAQIKENGYEIRVSEIKLYHHLGMSPSTDYAFFFKNC